MLPFQTPDFDPSDEISREARGGCALLPLKSWVCDQSSQLFFDHCRDGRVLLPGIHEVSNLEPKSCFILESSIGWGDAPAA